MATINPLRSTIKDIILGGVSIYKRNDFCQFEKIEFAESIFQLFPSGAITVRDTSDIISKIEKGDVTSFQIKYDDGSTVQYFITSYSYVGNAASSTEENFVAINFSNELFKINQNISVTEMMQYTSPQVYKIEDLFTEIVAKLQDKTSSNYADPSLVDSEFESENYFVYRPINPLAEKTDIASENPVQYLYYVSSLAADKRNKKPRYLFWTGFENEFNLKYFHESVDDDPGANTAKRYAVYEADIPEVKVKNKLHKKIYLLTTSPANQYLNRQYYYTRKTPKILNKQDDSANGVNLLFQHQYFDDGSRYDVELVTDAGVVGNIPADSGYSSLSYENWYGYYTVNDVNNNFMNSTLLGLEYGTRELYASDSFFGVNAIVPFIDTPEMWKNMFDLTPVHPDLGTSITAYPDGKETNLQKIYDIRNVSKSQQTKSEKIKEAEKLNFIYYVLCCLQNKTEEPEESFFACITGWEADTDNPQIGFNNESLVYRYRWKRIGVNLNSSNLTDFSNFTLPESDTWIYTGEESSEDDFTTFAINLNERKNQADSPTTGYYAPGWYAANMMEQLFENVSYRPIANRTGDLTESQADTGECFHIVKMTKVPFIKLIKEAANYFTAVTDTEKLSEIMNAANGKYLYYFELANITDGPCGTNEQ